MNRSNTGHIKTIILVMVLMISCMVVGNTCYAGGKNGWSGNYFYVNGKKQTSKWVKDKSGTYYVDSAGKMITGWKKIKGAYYYFNEGTSGKIRNSRKKTGVRLTKLSNDVLTMGIDMSEWQGNVNWKKIKASGVDFVMLRLGYGKGRYGAKNCTIDKKFRSYVYGASEVGIPIGIYFYSYATTVEQALKEAEFTIKSLQGINVEFPIAYDIEDNAIVQATDNATRTEMAKTYMDTIEAAGYTAMFYCNQNWYENYLNSDELSEYEFWYARYTYEEPNRDAYCYGMWQATSTQRLSGITQNTVDLNFLYEDYFEIVEPRDTALKYGWHEENGGMCYYYQGEPHESGWLTLAGKKYYLQDGMATVGFITVDGQRYYFDEDGEMQTGFVEVDNKIYMLDDEGIMQTTTDEPGVTIQEDGSCLIETGWHEDSDGEYIYRYSSGNIAKSKWIKKNGKQYYCDRDGYRVTGFVNINKDQYYFNENGVMKKGWLTYKNNKYYFKANGKMVKSQTMKIKGKSYQFNSKGQLVN